MIIFLLFQKNIYNTNSINKSYNKIYSILTIILQLPKNIQKPQWHKETLLS